VPSRCDPSGLSVPAALSFSWVLHGSGSCELRDHPVAWQKLRVVMRTLHVVVHPESAHHVEHLVGGWYDAGLTAAGFRDAVSIAHAVRAAVPEGASVTVRSSDLIRAAAAAHEIAERLRAPVTLDAGLREKSYGVAEGRPQAWLDERFVPPPLLGERMDHDEGIAGAETKQAFATRIFAAVERALTEDVDHTVLVTHGFALTFVVAAWLRLPIASLGFMNLRSTAGGITTLREDDFFRNRQVVRLDDTSHLTHAPLR
jgi:2,3-bisphosphoglycerate-dependent phosphoglycerate mutase